MSNNILYINGYSDPNYGGKAATFKVLMPPEKITITYALKYKQDNPNTSGKKTSFEGYDEAKINFSFVMDTTGAFGWDFDYVTIQSALDDLSKVVYKPNVEKHRPYYIEIVYGTMNMKCNLDNVQIDYVLFDQDGNPMRVKVTMSLTEQLLPNATQERKFASPDMTHIKFFTGSENIFMFCKEIYDDFTHYVQIAAVNNILNFREIPPGSNLIFPPFKKA